MTTVVKIDVVMPKERVVVGLPMIATSPPRDSLHDAFLRWVEDWKVRWKYAGCALFAR
jgi:hypothetical protein